jgi:hypothetical protein
VPAVAAARRYAHNQARRQLRAIAGTAVAKTRRSVRTVTRPHKEDVLVMALLVLCAFADGGAVGDAAPPPHALTNRRRSHLDPGNTNLTNAYTKKNIQTTSSINMAPIINGGHIR